MATQNDMDEFHKPNINWKRPDTKGCIGYDLNYIKFKNRQSWFLVIPEKDEFLVCSLYLNPSDYKVINLYS